MRLNCAVQLRLHDPAPCCPHCRKPWPGAVADGTLEQACRENNAPLVQNWQPLPVTDEVDEPVVPAGPSDLAVLCCPRLIAVGIE